VHPYEFVHTNKRASWHTNNTTSASQLMTITSASYVFALVDDKKNTTSASCRGSRPSWALVEAGCSNQLQLAQGQKP